MVRSYAPQATHLLIPPYPTYMLDPPTTRVTSVAGPRVQICKQLGGTIDDSELVHGMVFEKGAMKSAGGPTRVENAKVSAEDPCLSGIRLALCFFFQARREPRTASRVVAVRTFGIDFVVFLSAARTSHRLEAVL